MATLNSGMNYVASKYFVLHLVTPNKNTTLQLIYSNNNTALHRGYTMRRYLCMVSLCAQYRHCLLAPG